MRRKCTAATGLFRFGGVFLLILGIAYPQVVEAQSGVGQARNGEERESQVPTDAEYYPAVSLLPPNTQGFIELQELPALLDRWDETSLSRMQHDPAMRPFIESQRDAIEAKLSEIGVRAGVRLSDLREAVSGELVIAWMGFEDPRRPFSVALIADTRGRGVARETMLKRLDAGLRERGAEVSSTVIRDFPAAVYTLPRKPGQLSIERFGVVTVNERVIVSDRTEMLASLVSSALDGRRDSIQQVEDYQGVFQQESLALNDAPVSGETFPHVRWFARPIEMGMIIRELAGVDRGNRIDILKLLQDQGFDAVRALGGAIYSATEHYDLLHRGFVYAPATVSGPEKYENAARMLQFPRGKMETPPDWILPEAATFLQMKWKMQEAFWAAEPLVDGAFDSEVFRQMLDGLHKDPNGVQIDVANDVVAQFEDTLVVLSDNRRLEDRTQERVLGAIRLKDADSVARVINGALERDPGIFQLDYPGHVIWEVRPEATAEVEDFDVDLGIDLEPEFAVEDDDEEPQQEPVLENVGITIFKGYLIFASHSEMLVDLIDHANQDAERFADQSAYGRVDEAMRREGGSERSMEWIQRTDLSWRIKYELLRARQFLESDSLLASLIRRARENAEQAISENARPPLEIDMSKLPPFEQIRKYLQPGGGFVNTEEDGWSFTNFLLRTPS